MMRAACLVVIAILSSARSQGAQTAPRSADALMQEARATASAGRVEDALASCRKAIELAPNDAELRWECGELLKTMGRLADAISEFDTALLLDPKLERAELSRADAFRRIPNYLETRRALEAAKAAHPLSPAPLVALGELEIEMQNYDKAIEHLRGAIALAPNDLTARVDLGVAHRARSEMAEALKEFDFVLQRDPERAAAYYFRGSTYADQNQNEPAFADAQKVVALTPDSRPGRLLLASVSIRLGKCPEAVELLETLTASAPDDTESLTLLGRAYRCSGNVARANETTAKFEEASKREQSNRENQTQARNLVIKANELARKNQPVQALEALREALEKDPKNGPAYSQLAKIYASAGRLDEARTAIDQALADHPDNPDYLYVLGRILASKGDPAGALQVLERTVRLNPRDAESYFTMGMIHARQNDRSRAIDSLKKAVELAPDDEDYKRALAELEGK